MHLENLPLFQSFFHELYVKLGFLTRTSTYIPTYKQTNKPKTIRFLLIIYEPYFAVIY
jgi:hypothetical protein